MAQADGMQLAEFNIGTLKSDWDDPRVADFRDNLDRVYGIAERSPGYVWHLSGEDMEAAQIASDGALGGNPRTASTLSVWKDAASLEQFAYLTAHKQFYDRKAEWYDEGEQTWGGHRLVMWFVPEGHRPTIDEAVERLSHLVEHGDTDFAFGWGHLKDARLWREKRCAEVA